MKLVGVLVVALALAAGPAAAKIRDGVVVAKTREGRATASVTAAPQLKGSTARFEVTSSQPPREIRGRTVVMGTLDDASQRVARGATVLRVRAVSLYCEVPTVAIVGTAAPAVERVEVVMFNRADRALRRRTAPRRWSYDGRIVAGFISKPPERFEVRALDDRGSVIARRKFDVGPIECD